MNFLLIGIVSSVVIYLSIAFTLTLLPIARDESPASLDFDKLDIENLPEFDFTENYYTARDGGKLFYRLVEGNADTVIVLIHGSGTEGRYLLPFAARLNENLNASVIVPDLRGHGNSALESMGDINYLGQFEHDLEDLHTALATDYPNAKYFLGGHSSGGGLALKHGASGNSKYHGYILLAPYLGYNAPTVRADSGGWVQVSMRRYAGLSMLNQVGISWFNNRSVLFFNRPDSFDDHLQADHYTYRLNESFSPMPYGKTLENNDKPLLVLIGEDDEAFYANEFAAAFDKHAPHADVQVLPGLKHLDLPSSKTTADMTTAWVKLLNE